MPPKSSRSSVIHIQNDDLLLPCEWCDCQLTFCSMQKFMAHVTEHLNQHFRLQQRLHAGNTVDGGVGPQQTTQQLGAEEELKQARSEAEGLRCHWRECGTDIEGEPSDFIRHVYFHTFHVKIKCIGSLLLEKSRERSCSLTTQHSRNLIPELPERLECGWQHCHFMFENAELFYRHVENHGESFPEGNHVKNGCRCGWDGCEVTVKSKHKLKDHLRSHTQEKLVACPTCGALFSSRTKFFDHLHRQVAGYTGKRYQCSHCNRTFASERLLRDHMRNHVNQYKCPYCDMTSPSPSCLRLHIRYRHTQEKPYKCQHCDHCCKSTADLKKHMDTHNEEEVYRCQETGCGYSARGYQSLANHYKYRHQSSSYECHVCNCVFMRGSLLTKHLKTSHSFSWPSGHSRFRYKLHSDGMYRLQTVRYETVQLATQPGEQMLHPATLPDTPTATDDTVNRVDTSLKTDTNIDTFDALNDQNSQYIEVSSVDNLHANNSKSETKLRSPGKSKKGKKRKVSQDSSKRKTSEDNVKCKPHKVLSDTSNVEGEADDEEAGVKISITMDSDGNCVFQTDTMPTGELVSVSQPASQQIEENMYNLQMLGEVALQKQTKIT